MLVQTYQEAILKGDGFIIGATVLAIIVIAALIWLIANTLYTS